MNISKVSLEFTSKDILSIVNEYIKIPSLNIETLDLGQNIDVLGNVKIGGRFTFRLQVAILEIHDDIILVKVDAVKIGKIKVFNWITNIAMKKICNELIKYGLIIRKDIVYISYKSLFKQMPFYLDCNIKALKLLDGKVVAEVEDVCFSLNKELDNDSKKNLQENSVNSIDENEKVIILNKAEDGYTKIREVALNKVPDKYDKLLEYALILPDIVALFFRLFKDKRVPIKTKIVVAAVIAYLASPIDILPDFIPFIGQIDDLAFAFFALNKIIDDIPSNIILENWQGNVDIIVKVKEGIRYISKVVGSGNVAKLVSTVSNLWKDEEKDKRKECCIEEKKETF